MAFRVLEVDGEAFLVPVEDRIEAGASVVEPPRVVALERLHLDHFGAEIREREPAGRAHHHVRELDYTHPFKKRHGILWARRRGRSGRRSAPSAAPRP